MIKVTNLGNRFLLINCQDIYIDAIHAAMLNDICGPRLSFAWLLMQRSTLLFEKPRSGLFSGLTSAQAQALLIFSSPQEKDKIIQLSITHSR